MNQTWPLSSRSSQTSGETDSTIADSQFAVKAGWVQDYSRVISSYVSSIRLCGPKDCNYVTQKMELVSPPSVAARIK